MTEPSDDLTDRDRGAGLMIVILVAGAVMCVGSIGGASFFIWKAARNARERDLEAMVAAERVAAEQAAATADAARFELLARAVSARLNIPDGLKDSYSADGKPLLSWRVHLLPAIGEAELYYRFKLDEPWDGPTNRELIEKIPKVYDHSGDRGKWMQGWTYVRGFSQPGAIFEPKAKVALKDFSPGPEQTLAIFDSAEPVEWTKPDTLDWRDRTKIVPVGGSLPESPKFLAATASGRVVWIDRTIQPEVLWQISSRRHEPAWDERAQKWID